MRWLSSRFLIMLELALNQLRSLEFPMDRTLHHFFRERPTLGGNERHTLAETLFTWVRHRDSLQWLVGENASTRRLALLTLVRHQGIGIGQLEGMITAEEMTWLQNIKAQGFNKLSEAPLATQHDCPEWLFDKLSAELGEHFLPTWRALQRAAPLDLRINPLKISRENAINTLIEAGLEPVATPYSPLGIRLNGRPDIQKLPLFKSGAIEVQDEGSQLLGLTLGATRHHTVIDFCAGAGGKTLLLGALMNNQGRLYAFDTSALRLDKLKPRLKRASLSNVMVHVLQNENDTKVKRLAGKVDKVLVDAPCSGLGTLRRNPDLKWRQTPESLIELKDTQQRILTSASRLVKKGGQIVYGTCSILAEENEQIINAFLETHPDFQRVDLRGRLKNIAPTLAETMNSESLQLWPHLHHTDGFFAALLEKSA